MQACAGAARVRGRFRVYIASHGKSLSAQPFITTDEAMPIYEYQCAECGHAFEKLQPNAASRPGKCPACGKAALKKRFSTFSAAVASSAKSCADACPAAGACGGGRRGPSPCAGGACPMSGF